MPVAELQRRLSSAELTEWVAFARIEPFGCQIEDYRAGIYAAIKANAGRTDREPIGPLALFPWNEEPTAEPVLSEPEKVAQDVLAMFGQLAPG